MFYDLASLSTREDPQDLSAGHYTGILGPSFFVEAQYSERNFLLGVGSGSPNTDLIGGTVIEDQSPVASGTTPATSAALCGGEDRNNENLLAKGSYFLTTENVGTHDLVVGYDTYTDIRRSDNHQSGSDFTVWHTEPAIISGQDIFPVFTSGGSDDWILWWPILEASKGTDLITNSLYANDNWQLNEKLSFNLGLRYDENDGKNAAGDQVAKDDQISPASWPRLRHQGRRRLGDQRERRPLRGRHRQHPCRPDLGRRPAGALRLVLRWSEHQHSWPAPA